MPRVSKETERKLLAAVEKTAEYVNAGDDPNLAIAKAAQDLAVPRSYLTQIVYAYNTARTNWQRTHGTTVFDKAAEFPVAELPKVEAILYPQQVKTAATVQRETRVSPEYSKPPEFLMEKAAEALPPIAGVTTAPQYRREESGCTRQVFSLVQQQKRAVEAARTEVSAAFDKLAAAMDRLDYYFRQVDSLPITQVQKTVALWGEPQAEAIINGLADVRPDLVKMAAQRRPRPDDCTQPPYTLIREVMAAVADYRRVRQRMEKTADAALRAETTLRRPFFRIRTASVLSDDRPGARTSANILDSVSHSSLAEAILPEWVQTMRDELLPQVTDPTKRVEQLVDALSDPRHEQELRKIRIQTMLEELLVTDPVLSNYDPETVIDAFNEIAEIAPEVVTNRVLLRTLLRKHVEQGGLDTFEINEILNARGQIQNVNRTVESRRHDAERLQMERERARREARWRKEDAAAAKEEAKLRERQFEEAKRQFERKSGLEAQQYELSEQQARHRKQYDQQVLAARQEELRLRERAQAATEAHNEALRKLREEEGNLRKEEHKLREEAAQARRAREEAKFNLQRQLDEMIQQAQKAPFGPGTPPSDPSAGPTPSSKPSDPSAWWGGPTPPHPGKPFAS